MPNVKYVSQYVTDAVNEFVKKNKIIIKLQVSKKQKLDFPPEMTATKV